MESWIVPALGAIGVPLLISWLKNVIERGDKAQQDILDRLERDLEDVKMRLGNKADSHQSDALMKAIQDVSLKLDSLNTLVLTELGKRPSREEVMALLQSHKL
jgi:hypothetical protein